jgi:SAM-dependent methyltransferase
MDGNSGDITRFLLKTEKSNSYTIDHLEQVKELISVSSNYIWKSTTLLHLACGTGHLTAMLYDLYPNLSNVVGLSTDITMIKLAEDEHCTNRPNLNYEIGTLTNFKFSDQIDTILYLADLNKHQSDILTNCFNNLEKNGCLLFSGYVENNVIGLFGDFDRLVTDIGFKINNMIKIKSYKSNKKIKIEICGDNIYSQDEDTNIFNELTNKKIRFANNNNIDEFIYICAIMKK